MNKKKKVFLVKKIVLLGLISVLSLNIIACLGSTKYEEKSLNTTIGFVNDISKDTNFDYVSLDSDTNTTKTFGKVGKYAISINMVDSYLQAIEKYGSLEKAKKDLKITTDGNEDLDGTLFTLCLSSYIGGLSKNVGTPIKEEILNLSNGSWIHYSNMPKKENGDTMETYLTWNNGCFYYVEVAYKDELNISINDTISNIKFTNGMATLPTILK